MASPLSLAIVPIQGRAGCDLEHTGMVAVHPSCDPQVPNRIVKGPEVIMEAKPFVSLLEERIHRYDLLSHPFYQAWSAGELTREDLRTYAEDYYAHVEAFPGYLAQFGVRLEESELRRAVLANMTDEKGGEDSFGAPGRSPSA